MSDSLTRVGEALVARRAEIAAAIVARLVAEIPNYRRATPELIADVERLATATAELLGRAFATGSTLQREYVPIVRDQAARRVHQGVSLEAFLHAYRVALFEFWDAFARAAAELDIPAAESLELARFALDAIDTMTTHAAEAYLREEARVRTQSGREARDLVERLIAGEPVPAGRRHPAAPGLDPTAQLVTVVGRVEATERTVGEALQLARDALETSLALGRVKPLLAIRQGEVVLVGVSTRGLSTARRRALEEHGVDVRYGVSVPAPGFPGVRQAYRQAALSLSYTSATRPIVSLQELSALECALIGADATTRALIAAKGAAVRALGEDERETVRAFAAQDLNVTRTAARMHVHANTVRYRLRRIAALTGHDPRTFAGLVELVCVLEL